MRNFVRQMSLSSKIIMVFVFGALVLSASLFSAIYMLFESEMRHQAQARQDSSMQVAWDELRERATTFRVENGQFFVGQYLLNGDTAIVDAVKAMMGGTATIFMGDTRVATNVIKEGSRAVGTKLAQGPVYDEVLKRGEPYRGEADILGEKYFTAYDPIKDEKGKVIGMLYVGLKQSEYAKPIYSILYRLGGVALLVSSVIAALTSFFVRCQLRPLRLMKESMVGLQAGETQFDVPARDRCDEIGAMARAVQVFKDNAIERVRLEAEQVSAREAENKRRQALDRLTEQFSADVNGIVQAVVSAAAQMKVSSETMSATAGETSRQASGVAAASQQASGNVQMVAAAAEELAASIREISRQMAQSHTMTDSAAGEAETARGTVKALADVANRIGAVVTLINDIASQTNLLALNATIEAARAGDAGKGFAVVASEVKALATQTTKATDEIAAQINAVQGEITGTVGAIEGISTTIGRINEIAATIAAAVEQQQAATSEIARNVDQAATGTADVSSTIGSVTTAAGETDAAANEVMQAACQLGAQAEALQALVDGFTVEIHRSGLGARELIKLAKDDHRAFKQKILDVVDGRLKLRADQVPDHYTCRLGRWYDSADANIRRHPAYQQLLEPHKRMHDAARQVLVVLEQSGPEAARRACSPLNEASEAVLRALDALEAQILAAVGSCTKEAA